MNLESIETPTLLALGVVAFLLYFFPSIIARCRFHHNGKAIFATNLLLGWTFIGWAIAMIWAFTEARQKA